MKRINLDHLNQRLPADKNFVEFVNSAATENIIALCKSLFPDDKAIILYGIEKTTTGYSAGAIYYGGEIFSVAAFLRSGGGIQPSSYCIREITTKVTYMSGDLLPGYIERRIFPIYPGDNDEINAALNFTKLIRLRELNKTFCFNHENDNTGLTGFVQMCTSVRNLAITIDLALHTGSYIFTPMFRNYIQEGINLLPNQFLGYVTLLCEKVWKLHDTSIEGESPEVTYSESAYRSDGIVAEKKYKLFLYENKFYLAETTIKNFDDPTQCVTFENIRQYFRSVTSTSGPYQYPLRISFYHQTIAQL
jgi:hypothetical protein